MTALRHSQEAVELSAMSFQPHRTARHIRWIGARKIRCEDDTNESLVVGRVESPIGVQVERVESEVVLSGEGNNNEGACDMLCKM